MIILDIIGLAIGALVFIGLARLFFLRDNDEVKALNRKNEAEQRLRIAELNAETARLELKADQAALETYDEFIDESKTSTNRR